MGKFNDLMCQKFGRLTVIGYSIKRETNGGLYWECICDCGNLKEIAGQSLIKGNTKSCGCLAKELIFKRKFKDLTGKRFGRLTVLKIIEERNNHQQILYNCKCDCGIEKIIVGASLVSLKTTSCGCLLKEKVSLRHLKIIERDTKFGRWTVLELIQSKNNQVYWLCQCDCGVRRPVRAVELRRGTTVSCGCRGRGNHIHGTIYGIYDEQDNLKYIGQTVRYKLQERLNNHLLYSFGKLKGWFKSIEYKPIIKPLIENVKIENLDMMEKQLIQIVTKEYHSLLNTKYHS